jgi:hypothetical protein
MGYSRRGYYRIIGYSGRVLLYGGINILNTQFEEDITYYYKTGAYIVN